MSSMEWIFIISVGSVVLAAWVVACMVAKVSSFINELKAQNEAILKGLADLPCNFDTKCETKR